MMDARGLSRRISQVIASVAAIIAFRGACTVFVCSPDAIIRLPATGESYTEIEALVRQREEHRIAKRWDDADAIREQLKSQYKVRPCPYTQISSLI
jgi:cysteinyl-tRNA synthetase